MIACAGEGEEETTKGAAGGGSKVNSLASVEAGKPLEGSASWFSDSCAGQAGDLVPDDIIAALIESVLEALEASNHGSDLF